MTAAARRAPWSRAWTRRTSDCRARARRARSSRRARSARCPKRREGCAGHAERGESAATRRSRQGALADAADALTKAAASLARDRERANSANSASGFSEMIQQMQEMAQKQGQINSQAQGLMGCRRARAAARAQSLARQLARQQRNIADQLEDAGDGAGGDRAAQLAREARQLADALDNGRLDASTLARQQQLFRRLLDAGRSLQKDERDDSGKREATSAKGDETFTPTGERRSEGGDQVPAADVAGAARAVGRRASRDPRLLHPHQQCARPVAGGAAREVDRRADDRGARPRQARERRARRTAEKETPEVTRAIELENSGKFREAIPIYRKAMRTHSDADRRARARARRTPSSG